ncbi:NAD(P)H-dependent oxidoreductase [Pseudarthrobacter sp. BRE9]|uniref:flavodoxin family protein n=1 Tax=Pseudarthrobacter sp. BRE9 TaxID=2962582 RepID=UPI002881AD70|nr:NAD(P)H-dependent oxidoreductase [Pseudarthrobacter sp. BRE9]MDT0168188.1 NAD(P)H-dependent oxidoreductase [Pseudarthrobacter sp. BRE9]
MSELSALALVCTLTPSPEPSSSELMAQHILDELEGQGVTTESVRVVDFDVKRGVQVDMGNGDQWPAIRARILAADILVFSTPIWMDHPCSVAQQVMERLDADLSETDDDGRPIMYGNVATVAVVGNEDGAHKTIADMMQGLNDVGFSLPAQGGTYWVGEAMQTVDFKDLDQVPDPVASTNSGLARNAVHLARYLRSNQYPAK